MKGMSAEKFLVDVANHTLQVFDLPQTSGLQPHLRHLSATKATGERPITHHSTHKFMPAAAWMATRSNAIAGKIGDAKTPTGSDASRTWSPFSITAERGQRETCRIPSRFKSGPLASVVRVRIPDMLGAHRGGCTVSSQAGWLPAAPIFPLPGGAQ